MENTGTCPEVLQEQVRTQSPVYMGVSISGNHQWSEGGRAGMIAGSPAHPPKSYVLYDMADCTSFSAGFVPL